MNIEEKFKELFRLELTEKNVDKLMKSPLKKDFNGAYLVLNNWKKHQTKPVNELQNKALTLIFLKLYKYFA